jgi:biopolymer transport protein ExbB
MWQFFVKGGIVMVPLVLCSITSLIIILERILFYSLRSKKREEQESGLLKLYLSEGKLDEARMVAAKWENSFGRIVNKAIKQWETDKSRMEQSFETAGETELKDFQRGLGLLDTIVTISPLLGLLGTVTGIIKSFAALSASGGAQATHLSLGIAEALYTTAFGLAIAIPTVFFLNLFYSFADKQAEELTSKCREILAILQEG